jgi:hypothetical protein
LYEHYLRHQQEGSYQQQALKENTQELIDQVLVLPRKED